MMEEFFFMPVLTFRKALFFFSQTQQKILKMYSISQKYAVTQKRYQVMLNVKGIK